MLELLNGEFLLGDNVFDQVADGDEADELALVDDRQVPQSVFRHNQRRHYRTEVLLRGHSRAR